MNGAQGRGEVCAVKTQFVGGNAQIRSPTILISFESKWKNLKVEKVSL